MTTPFIRRLTLRNYKSIAACKVDLGALTFLVGPNGSGKSNFLDAIRFVSDSLTSSLDHALRERGTIKEVRRRSGGHPNHFAIRIDFALPEGQIGHYSFRVGAKPRGAFEVQEEECVVHSLAALGENTARYRVRSGRLVEGTVSPQPASLPDRLYLVAMSGVPEFRPLFDALSSIQVYNLVPNEIRAMQKPDPGVVLRRDGSNAASVLQNLGGATNKRINYYLARIVRGISGVGSRTLGSQETVEFRQDVQGQAYPWRFLASSMSDGTLRAFGVLLAIFQKSTSPPLLVGLEEPEMALHPAAAAVLLAALREAADDRQVLVTSHSPDLLDNPDIPTDSVIAVDSRVGVSMIGPIDDAGRKMLHERLFTPGELLRQDQLAPSPKALFDVSDERQLGLFGDSDA